MHTSVKYLRWNHKERFADEYRRALIAYYGSVPQQRIKLSGKQLKQIKRYHRTVTGLTLVY